MVKHKANAEATGTVIVSQPRFVNSSVSEAIGTVIKETISYTKTGSSAIVSNTGNKQAKDETAMPTLPSTDFTHAIHFP